MKRMSLIRQLGLLALVSTLLLPQGFAQDGRQPLLTVKEVMNAIITPMTSTIWGAYQLESDAEWQEVENAALTVIAAGNLLAQGGSQANEKAWAAEEQWQVYNNQMIAAAREVIAAVSARDEEALFNAGNDALYPPCESCHQDFQPR